MMRMLGRDFDSDDAEGLRGCAVSPAVAMMPERGGRLTGIAARQARRAAHRKRERCRPAFSV
ncbi:hypothetical protein BOSE62_70127 [Bosea sp. 62]|nr:hypothetical protein BOSE21B_100052 [Bosea sp. 21B]CAD5286834.1 hypothetical protein BOSE7B_41476 [Bosea sp. 7B]CAD5301249.1 hypothetical protein BOSE46_90432 [Bosea sp. 46]VVT57357.1 hypothetical protein BOS5A_200052 [Bosea sp. EC-HK365B]VXB66857.1 hypothetical protein BOSE125_140144 [Bosea sp. 125]VXC69411.1 hypothetical protein BOSE62_70127 [Bosea sp. 62]VXC95088.1 hypothetical protein BOSE127_80262 [Bosea sp. 127]VXC95646.1 hypothetical protein BOSE29B_90049 [Bosea sp. 29B]